MAEYLVSDGTGIMEEKTRWLYDEESNHCACVCASVESTMPAFLTFIVLRRRVGLRWVGLPNTQYHIQHILVFYELID